VSGLVLGPALELVRGTRRNSDVVVSTMGPAREWLALGALHPLDFVLVPSAMGHATSLGLGLALARPDHRVIVLNGDGSMLMNLGSLVTITAERPGNLVIVVCDNGAYEVTGAQPTPGAASGRVDRDALDWGAMARAAGFRSVFCFGELSAWRTGMAEALAAPGPVFIHLEVVADPAIGGPRSPGPAADRAGAFRRALESAAGVSPPIP
jgi:thiamine pyrophosphate-dependent acetolactate synthase large subunit-like protein